MNKSITKQMIYAARLSQLCIGSCLEKYGITAAEEPFFMAVQAHAGADQETLTSLVGVDKAATTRAVCSLEKKGFLTRRQDERDRRQKRIYPTEKSTRIYSDVLKELLRLNEAVLDGIPDTDRETVYRALLKMGENLKNMRERREPKP